MRSCSIDSTFGSFAKRSSADASSTAAKPLIASVYTDKICEPVAASAVANARGATSSFNVTMY